ncbi:hypothetical protein HJC23_002177 [Cyclotella cryptica]|uniref:Uncharacterized protein n=1 Tax=Cyclotella cryptica TaxID=29204 RepID=A0ABD3Q8M1_9STRA|eukprot:CCRYP_008194-RA/>CCRYP_008194-RA protein AED:0.10 eAED:0.10 QI:0/-1/0/1/-1/1/1/0/1256
MPSDDGSRSTSSSIDWNPNWDDNDGGSSNSNSNDARLDGSADSPSRHGANGESSAMPPTCIGVALARPPTIKNESSSPPHDEHDGSSMSPHDDDASSQSSSDDPSQLEELLLAHGPNRATRYQMLGAPTLLYRHIPSYTDPSRRPSALTPHQIDMATYVTDHPVGTWFQRDNNSTKNKRTSANKGETYPHSIRKYMPTQGDDIDAARLVDRLTCANRARVRHFWANTNHKKCGQEAAPQTQYHLPMQYTNSWQGKARYLPTILEEERLKWLTWKLARWERKDQERWMRKQLLQDYYIERETRRLVSCWEKEEEEEHDDDHDDDGAKNKRRRRQRKGLDPDREAAADFSSCSSSSFASESSAASTWSSSTSSISTYYSDESAFQRWEENAVLELEGMSIMMPGDSYDEEQSICETDLKRMKLLSSWVFGDDTDGDGGHRFARNQPDEPTRVNIPKSDEYHYSLDELIRVIEKLKQSKELLTPLKSHQSANVARLKAGAEYFAPFRSQDVREESTQQYEHITVGGPPSYGNCLAILKCTCQSCLREAQRGNSDPSTSSIGKRLPSFFLVHPTGDLMSEIMISKLRLPRWNSDFSGKSPRVDVGDRILQITICGKSVATHHEMCLVVRTPSHCCIYIARPKGSRRSVSGTVQCPGTFELLEKARIDLSSRLGTSNPSYLPYHIAYDPKMCISFFTRPSFVMLCLDQYGTKCNIHHVTLKEEPQIKRHDLSSTLADISIIEFDPRDRHALWAAARPVIMPPIGERFFKRRGSNRSAVVEGLAGYGHSLYRINLRDNTADFVWSPSHEEFIVEGVYSINGIKSDESRDHILWINSTSAGKVWALDVRYKAPKVLVCWSLPSMCDDLGAHCSINGVHGAGVLMNQPLSALAQMDSLPTMFSLKKDLNTSSLNVYHFPSSMPRFQTRPLESAGFVDVPKSRHNTTSISRSSVFALPDTSDGIFNIGLAALELPSLTALPVKKLKQLGYRSVPAHAAYVITMNSIGDVYCHTLLKCDASEEPRAIFFPGLPVGTTSIPVSNRTRRNKRKLEQSDSEMVIELSNNFPIPSSAIASYPINDIRPLDVDAIKDAMKNREKDGSAFDNPNPVTFPESCGPRSFHGLIHPKQLRKTHFDVLILSPDEELKSNLNASINQDDLVRKFDIAHTAVGFGLSAANENKSFKNRRTKLERNHLLVAVQKNIEQVEEPFPHETADKNVGGLEQDILNRLEDRYLRADFNEEDINSLGVKEESSSSDAESANHEPL